jgi:methylase of polypeptide subunit release factors
MAVATLGVVYTPPEVTGPMVERALAPLLAGRSRAQLLELRLCDFAVGEGAFLIEIVRVVAAAHGGRDAKQVVAAHCVFGADRDPRAVAAAHAALEAYVGAPLPTLREHLRVGDALQLAWPRFDAVIGNPPYIRQEKLAPATKRALRGFESYDGVADLYVYFIELAHRLVRDGGRYGLVVPTKWLTAAYARPLRSFLARARSIETIEELAPRAFAKVDAFPCVITGTVGRARDAVTPERSSTGEPWHLDRQEDAAVMAQLERLPRLGAQLTPARGVVTGCNRAFVIDAATRARLCAEDPACAPLIRPLLRGRDVRRWVATCERYLLMMDRGVVPPAAIERHLAPLRGVLAPGSGRKPGSYAWFELQDPIGALAKAVTPRLFYQDIQSAPACSLDTTGLVPDTTVWILDTDDRFVLAVLNSRLYHWYAKRRFPPALNGAVRPKRAFIEQLPLAAPAPALRAQITALVTAQLAAPTPQRDAELDELICRAYAVSGNLIR